MKQEEDKFTGLPENAFRFEQKKFTDFNGDGSTGNYRCGDHNY